MSNKFREQAYIETITFSLFQISVSKALVDYYLPLPHIPSRNMRYVIEQFPILRWKDNTAWLEANIWLASLAQSIPLRDISIKTIHSIAIALLTFMRFCEAEEIEWNYLPIVPSDRTINRYRRFLIESRESGVIKPSTATQKMSVVIRLYRWCQHANNLTQVRFESITPKVVSIAGRAGRDLTKTVSVSNLRIPNRKTTVDRVEGGLLPVSNQYRDELLFFVSCNLPYELYLILRVAFESGLRVDSICDLKVNTIEWAYEDDSTPLLCWINVGPAVNGAPVRTKYGISGRVIIGKELLVELKEYSKSRRRLLREVKASEDCKELLFITSQGNSYSRNGNLGGSTINSLIHCMKKKARENKVNFDDFHIHRARATFGVNIVGAGMNCSPAIPLVTVLATARDLLLHANVDTTMKYVKYIQSSGVKQKYADQYSAVMLSRHAKSEDI